MSKSFFDIDSAMKHFIHKDSTFWSSVLVEICRVDKSIADIWIGHKGNMVTTAMLKHYRISGVSKQLSEYLAHFNKMSYEEIADMYELKEKRNFTILINCLNPLRTHDYGEFKHQTVAYMGLDNPP